MIPDDIYEYEQAIQRIQGTANIALENIPYAIGQRFMNGLNLLIDTTLRPELDSLIKKNNADIEPLLKEWRNEL